MSDGVDRAQAYEENARSDALAEVERRAQGYAAKPSAECCAVCDEPIAQARRLALPGVQTCIDCQRDLEWGLRC